MASHPNVVSDGDLRWNEQSHGEKFGYRLSHWARPHTARGRAAASTRCLPDGGLGPTTTT
jgi:hypothetical protein